MADQKYNEDPPEGATHWKLFPFASDYFFKMVRTPVCDEWSEWTGISWNPVQFIRQDPDIWPISSRVSSAFKPDVERAFPVAIDMGASCIATNLGMSLRDYFAAKAMQAIVIGNNADICTMGAGCAVDAYGLADAMLAERAK